MKQGKPFQITSKCKDHRDCMNQIACPAFFIWNDRVQIDPDLCTGCAVCAQICPENAILPIREKKVT
jgi:indolepyruvate ferredoxin oxidoreductase alpha subunit